MYSGTTFGRHSGRMLGVHQRIDRVARRHISSLLPKDNSFPTIKQILYFEGNNGPDGIKRKSPSQDEPWHFINPKNKKDKDLINLINDHIMNLSIALKKKNNERAAFEAAWLSHAIVDGLTPAHHYPLADKIEELWGKPHHERSSVKDKNVIKGTNRRDTISKNWQYWGGGGIFSKHLLFESGVATSILFKPFKDIDILPSDIDGLKKNGFEKTFMAALQDIVALDMYEAFGKKGWTHQLAEQSRLVLIPRIMKTVCLGWYQAVTMAEEQS